MLFPRRNLPFFAVGWLWLALLLALLSRGKAEAGPIMLALGGRALSEGLGMWDVALAAAGALPH